MLKYPTTTEYKRIIQINTIKNCPVTTQDINVAEDILGPIIPTLKGQTTQGKLTKLPMLPTQEPLCSIKLYKLIKV